ncbi:MAG: hypothetical protein HY703_13760, partial [Gemmatimonadetes bacterium]|nr:hypothetical protein [Gemmatimonadota bacterium]
IVADALGAGLLEPEELLGQTDEALLVLLEGRAAARPSPAAADAGPGDAVGEAVAAPGVPVGGAAERVGRWVAALRARRLPKRAAELVAAELGARRIGEWLVTDSALKRRVEERLAQELGLGPGAVLLDYPEKRAMFGLDLLVERRTGEVLRLGPGGRAGLIGLPRMADELYDTARVLRLFTFAGRREVEPATLARLAVLPTQQLEQRLQDPTPLL